jgi:hypothetical protein
MGGEHLQMEKRETPHEAHNRRGGALVGRRKRKPGHSSVSVKVKNVK